MIRPKKNNVGAAFIITPKVEIYSSDTSQLQQTRSFAKWET